MQRYAGKNDPNEYVDNGLHIPIDPVNYRITYPIQNVSEYGISTNRLTGIIESYEMTGVGQTNTFGGIFEDSTFGSYVRKFFSGMHRKLGLSTGEPIAYIEHTIVFQYGARLLCNIEHVVLDDGSSLLAKRTVFRSSSLYKQEQYHHKQKGHADTGKVRCVTYNLSANLYVSIGHDQSDFYMDPCTGNWVPGDAAESVTVRMLVGTRETIAKLDYDTYKDFEFDSFSAVVDHPTLAFDLGISAPGVYETMLDALTESAHNNDIEQRRFTMRDPYSL